MYIITIILPIVKIPYYWALSVYIDYVINIIYYVRGQERRGAEGAY